MPTKSTRMCACVCVCVVSVYLSVVCICVRGCVCSGHNTSAAKAIHGLFFHLNIPGTMLHYCLHICRILLKLHRQSTEQMRDSEHMRCFLLLASLLLNTGLGSVCPYSRLLEAAAKPRSRSECAPFPQPLIRAHCGGCASASVTGHSGTIAFCFSDFTPLWGSSFSVNCFDPESSFLLPFPLAAAGGRFWNTHQLAAQGQVLRRTSRSGRNLQAEEACNGFPPLFEGHWARQLHRTYSSSHRLVFHTENQHTKLSFSKSNFSSMDCLTISLILFTQLYEIHAFSLKLYIWCLSKIWGFFWAREKRTAYNILGQEGHIQQISKHI